MTTPKSKKISIIIPVYNVEQYVSKAAQSIKDQNFANCEVIIVDDGSTDASMEKCKQFLDGMEIIGIKQRNSGPGDARNTGIKVASGKYILFLDSDDYLLPDALSNIWDQLEKERPDVLFGRCVRWHPPDKFIKGKPYQFALPDKAEEYMEYILCTLPESAWNVWRYVLKNEFVSKNNLFFEGGVFCEDIKWVFSVLENAKSLSFMEQPFYAYNDRRRGSIMNSKSTKRILDLNANILDLLALYKNRPIICNRLIYESFYYINEYCTFSKNERKELFECYKNIMPLYSKAYSPVLKIVGKCNRSSLLYLLSFALFILKYTRRFFLKLKEKANTTTSPYIPIPKERGFYVKKT